MLIFFHLRHRSHLHPHSLPFHSYLLILVYFQVLPNKTITATNCLAHIRLRRFILLSIYLD